MERVDERGRGRRKKRLTADPEELFWHQLAAWKGYPTVEAAAEAVDAQEFATYQAVYQLRPWGVERVEYAVAMLAQFFAASKGVQASPDQWTLTGWIGGSGEGAQAEAQLIHNVKAAFGMYRQEL